jgi:hypothetical protein
MSPSGGQGAIKSSRKSIKGKGEEEVESENRTSVWLISGFCVF